MDINVYLPDEIGTRAKAADLPFSRMLRDAVEEELNRRAAIADTLSDGVEEHEVELEEATGVITGKFLGWINEDQVYLTDDERVLMYDRDRLRVDELQYPETELTDMLENDPRSEEIPGIMRKLGFRPRVRL